MTRGVRRIWPSVGRRGALGRRATLGRGTARLPQRREPGAPTPSAGKGSPAGAVGPDPRQSPGGFNFRPPDPLTLAVDPRPPGRGGGVALGGSRAPLTRPGAGLPVLAPLRGGTSCFPL